MFNKIRSLAFVTLLVMAVVTLVMVIALALTIPRRSVHTTVALYVSTPVPQHTVISKPNNYSRL